MGVIHTLNHMNQPVDIIFEKPNCRLTKVNNWSMIEII